MKNVIYAAILGLTVSIAGCSKQDALEIPTGSEVTVQKRDGVSVSGRLVEVKPEQVVLESPTGVKTLVRRSEIASVSATPIAPVAEAKPDAPPPAAASAEAARPEAEARPNVDAKPSVEPKADTRAEARRDPIPASDPAREYREVTIPTGTVLPLQLTSSVASDTSQVEDKVSATLRNALRVDGINVLPAGTAVFGNVTGVDRSDKVKGRASIAFRFNQIDMPGRDGRESIRTATVTRVAQGTKKKDATKIGVGAGAGAVIGGIIGGGSGAAKGAVIGGGAGTAAVLATRGDEVRLGPGAAVSATLTAPVTVRVVVK